MIKFAILSLLVLGCVHAAPVATPTAAPLPNRVCAMVALHYPDAKCASASNSPNRERDVARLDIEGGGVRYCWETFDQDGWKCTITALSKAETAQVAVQQERERAKQEADAKAKADAEKSKAKPDEAAKSPDAGPKAAPKPAAKAKSP